MRKIRRSSVLRIVPILLFPLVGCGGGFVDFPSSTQTSEAAVEAATSPATWAPLGLAAVFGLSGLDNDVSDWATDHSPIFGGRSNARDASDYLRWGLEGGMAASTLIAAALDDGDDGWNRIASSVVAYGGTRLATDGLKAISGRERPNGRNDESFPSGHSSMSFVSASLIEENLGLGSSSAALRAAASFGLYGLASATAWARVEAEEHYPSDVLAGAALGNFIARFSSRAFLGDDDDDQTPELSLSVGRDRAFLRLSFAGFGGPWRR
ncbi:MAG: phosphatase PAP2 family protein [Alphaproteobacteria bacterium]|nr:phosphatase PAP2 family protein [Alphaproteobacteria bacterium]